MARNVDVRGEGGYVVIAPSVHPSGNVHRWLRDRAPWQVKPPLAPDELLSRVVPAKPALRQPPSACQAVAGASRGIVGHRYAEAALVGAVSAVLGAPCGQRNVTLNREAFATARLVVAGRLDSATWRCALAEAAARTGLAEWEIEPTLASALQARRAGGHG